MAAQNLHATTLVLGTRGIAILGKSGTGKSSLARRLLDQARLTNTFGALIADDRTWFEPVGTRLVARAPQAIVGLIEIRGFGPCPVPHLEYALIDLVVELVPDEEAPRVWDDTVIRNLCGIELPLMQLARWRTGDAAHAILAYLAPHAGSF
jgi:HPr kinase/phosphorylase